MGSDKFPERVKRGLRDRVNNLCSICRKQTTGPHHDPEKAITVGEAAHITAASAEGPRYDASLTPRERRLAANGIWVCARCHRIIDADPYFYPVSRLIELKGAAEAAARLAIDPAAAFRNTPASWRCPRCGNGVENGLLGCWRCGAEIVYGLSRKERKEWFQLGSMGGVLASSVTLSNVPGWLNTALGFHVAPYFGSAGLFLGGIIFIASTCGLVLFAETTKRRKPPRFMWQSIS